jgi:hypothetical protein
MSSAALWQKYGGSATPWLAIWLLMALVGFSLYVGLRLLGMMPAGLGAGRGFLAACALAGGFAILLAIDNYAVRDKEVSTGTPPRSIAGLLYLLFAQRPALLAFLLNGLLVLALVSYYLFKSLVTVERAGYGFTIRLPGQTVHLYPIHPYGWQNTGIEIEAGREFTVELTGRASVGFLNHVPAREEYLERLIDWTRSADPAKGPPPAKPALVDWPFTGPNGYPSEFYRANAGQVAPYVNDPWLTVQRLPHNSVVGLIVASGQTACAHGPKPEEPCRAMLAAGIMKPGYVFGTDAGLIHFPEQLSSHTVSNSGQLWITINDADEARWDNSGMFFMKLTVKE